MNFTKEFFDFIGKCPTAMHTVDTVKNILLENGFAALRESDFDKFSLKGRFFVTRGDSSIIAFKNGENIKGFSVAASHTDTPAFKITGIEERRGAYVTVPVEKYGGSILYSWLDRPLSLAGRVVVRTEKGISVRLIAPDVDLFSIPSIAIHQNRSVNDGYKFNPAVDMLPLLSLNSEGSSLLDFVANAAGATPADLLSSDLYVYNREEGRVFGLKGEFILSPRLDNLASVYTSLKALLDSEDRADRSAVFAAFDNEEVGNSTKQGANSTFLSSVLTKIAGDEKKLSLMIENSFMVSLDNSHAKHPNHPELSNPSASPLLGGGVAVKYHANQFYTTDAVSDGIIRTIADKVGAPLQSFATRADMLSGSTLGSVATTRIAIPSVDLGIPQLAMHSSTETCAISDLLSAAKLIGGVYSAGIKSLGKEVEIDL